MIKYRQFRKFQGPSQQQKELAAIRNLCSHLSKLSESQRLEAIYRRNQDYMDLKVNSRIILLYALKFEIRE